MPDDVWNWPSDFGQIIKIYISILEMQIFLVYVPKSWH
jgi:hypothetical protein